jgi:hemerythrin-like domain-containing protein
MHKLPLPELGARTPAASFDEPFDMLSACHERVRRSLDLLQRLVVHTRESGADPRARDAARDVLRYFTMAAPAHHEDEERHVVPALRASGKPAALAAAQRMLDEHVAIREAWQMLQPLLQVLSEGSMPDARALQGAADRFVELHAPHLALEDSLAFPHAAQEIDRRGGNALRCMGDEMARRRGAPIVPRR